MGQSSEAGVRPLLLLVEDDDGIRRLIRSMLAGENIDLIEASTGGEGLRLAEAAGRSIDILLTDMLLPELSGYDLAAELKGRFPDMRIIMVTGYVEGEIVQRGKEELGAAFLDKPFQAAELRRIVAETAAAVRAAAG
jgi:two-component system, cell cycle sensor histidine kinase and response regulator CckA